jgi:hypothetical protein
MQRSEAKRVFALLNDLNGDLRGRIVSERWWLVWIAMGVEILITSIITQLLCWNGETRLEAFLLVWGVHVGLIPPIIFFIHRRSGGQRTATETYIWWIWGTFIACSTLTAFFSFYITQPVRSAAPLVALLAAFAFSMMAMVTHRFFLVLAAAFVGVMLAMSVLPDYEFLIFGGAWCAALVVLGVYFRATRTAHVGERL